MFVSAPRRGTLGTTNVNRVLFARGGSVTSYATLAEALAHATDYNGSTSAFAGQTNRVIMQKGIVGPNRYIDTDYIASYWNQTHSGSETIVWRNSSTGRYQSENYPLSYGYSGFYGTGIAAFPPSAINPNGSGTSVPEVYNRAVIANLRNRIRTEVSVKALDSDFDGGEALTGLSPSVKMVTERTIQVLRAWIAVRKRNYRKAADVLGLRKRLVSHSPADIWLEMQYGWLPLINDIFDGTEEIRDLLDTSNDDEDKFFTVTRRGRDGLLVWPAANSTQFSKLTQTSEGYVTVESKVRYTIGDQFAAYMSSLRINNPLYIAWTAVPYSFVLDWLLPVGDMLSALGTPIGLKFKGGYVTTRCYGRSTATASGHSPSLAYPVVSRGGSASAELKYVYIQRTGLFTFPGPAIYVRFPLSSSIRAASAVSLIATAKKYR